MDYSIETHYTLLISAKSKSDRFWSIKILIIFFCRAWVGRWYWADIKETLARWTFNHLSINISHFGEKLLSLFNIVTDFSDQDHNWCNFQKIASMTFLEIENLSKIVYDVFPLHMDISDKFSDLLLLWILLITIRSDATLPKDCFGDVLRDRKIWTISSSDDMSLI